MITQKLWSTAARIKRTLYRTISYKLVTQVILVFWLIIRILPRQRKEMVSVNSFLLILIEQLVIALEGRGMIQLFSSQSRLLALTDANFEVCHTCLVEKVGVERIHLVAMNEDTRVYLIKGRDAIIESFLMQCNNGGIWCQLQTDIRKFPPCSSVLLQNAELEYTISLFSVSLDAAAQYKHVETDLSAINSYGRIAFLFMDEIPRMSCRQNFAFKTAKDHTKQNEIDMRTIPHDLKPFMNTYLIPSREAVRNAPSLDRCFYSNTRRFQCERCLALLVYYLESMHIISKLLKQAYNLYFRLQAIIAQAEYKKTAQKNIVLTCIHCLLQLVTIWLACFRRTVRHCMIMVVQKYLLIVKSRPCIPIMVDALYHPKQISIFASYYQGAVSKANQIWCQVTA